MTKKSRSKNSQIKANKQQHSNLKHNNKLTRHENESDEAAINRIEAAAAEEKAALEEKLEQVRRLQKNKQRKRQLQLQKNFSQDNVNNYNDENNYSSNNSQQQVVVPSEHQSAGDQSLQVRRRRKRRDFPSTSVNANSVNNSQTILLVQEEIDRIKSKSKENLIRANNLQQNPEEDVQAQPKASERINYPNATDKNNVEPDVTQAEAKNSSNSNLSRMPSSLQKRVSFILTNTSQEDSKIPENVQAQHNSTAESQSTIEISRRILKSRQPSSSSAAARNSLQAKVFSDQGTSGQSKPVLLSNYKIQSAHKTTNPTPTTRNPHIDSLQASSELVRTESESYVNLTNSSNLLNDTNDGMYQQQQKSDYPTSILIQHQSLLSKRNSASRTKTPTTTPTGPTALTRLSSSVNSTKPYSQASQAVSTSTTTIESMQRYSASKLNKSMSISAQDLAPPGSNSSKQLRLPPVNNGVIIGGSTNNLTTIGLSETVPKKKIKDLSHYCYFCQRKTGLASSYTCRLVIN